MQVVNVRQGPPYPQGKNHVSHSTGSVIGSRTGVDAAAKRKSRSRHEWELDGLIALYQPSYPAHIRRLFTVTLCVPAVPTETVPRRLSAPVHLYYSK